MEEYSAAWWLAHICAFGFGFCLTMLVLRR